LVIIDSSHNPERALDDQIAAMAQVGQAERCFALSFFCHQYYLPGEPYLHLLALVVLSAEKSKEPRIEVALLPYQPDLNGQLAKLTPGRLPLMAFAGHRGAPWLTLSEPLALAPVHIPKPWGKEIWHTGIEARGQSAVSVDGRQTPLPWLLELAPRRLASGFPRQLILLKELDPHSAPVFGDLYFEVHRRKQEVYVVTDLKSDAWPAGVGGVRYGFSPQKRACFENDRAFKRAYLQAVQEYEAVRGKVDAQLDERRLKAGLSVSAPVPLETLAQWQAELPAELNEAERQLRESMELFTAVRPVRVGDVVTVPPLTPHSLLHGVRVIEFQTPDYERHILSFGQKVLNQPRWDTADILGDIPLNAPVQHPPERWSPATGLSVEQLAEFPSFEVIRIVLNAGMSLALPQLRRAFSCASRDDGYLLIMGLQGEFSWDDKKRWTLRAGDTRLLANCCREGRFHSDAGGTLLAAMPREAS
jgi:hypothetical protein